MSAVRACTRLAMACAVLLSGVPRWAAAEQPEFPPADTVDDEAAVKRYVTKLEALFETRIVPDLRRGIVKIAASRPPGLTLTVTQDPSPYKIGARVEADGRLRVQLSLGYTTLHDAALDAAALSTVLNRPRDLGPYLAYQLRVVHENFAAGPRNEARARAMTFAEFIGLDRETTRAIYARPEWRASRDEAERQSLGWTVAYLLIRADPKLSGATPLPNARSGSGAARLAAASDWFPVPPFATALGLAEMTRSATGAPEDRKLLCGAALMMEGGVTALHETAEWRARLKTDSALQTQASHLQEQIAQMRRDGGCATAGGTAL